MQPGGVDIEDLCDLARRMGFPRAEIMALELDELADLTAREIFPIVYLNRAHFERRHSGKKIAVRDYVIHAVIPVRISRHFVTFNDPLTGTRRRVSRRTFQAAHEAVNNLCLVCQPG